MRRQKALADGPRSRPSSYLVAALACAMMFGCAQPELAPEPEAAAAGPGTDCSVAPNTAFIR